MLRMLEALSRRAPPILVAALFVGLALQPLAALCRPLLAPAVIVLLVCNLLRIDLGAIARTARHPARLAAILAWLTLGAPLAAWILVSLLPLPPALAQAVLLTVSSPVLTAVPAFALMMGLDGALALTMVVATTVLQPVLQPPLVYWILGIELDLPMGALMARLAIFVGGAFAIAAAARRLAGAERLRRLDGAIGGATVVVLVVFGIGLMDGVQARLLARPGEVLLYLAAGFGANFLLQALGIVVFRAADRRAGLTAALTGGCRNVATLVAVLGSAASPELQLFLAVGQFPIYFVPAVLGPAYRRLLRGGAA